MDAPDTLPTMDWHQITVCSDTTETRAMNVPGGALVRVSRSRRDTGSPNATIAEALTMVPGAVVAHRWQWDGTENYIEIGLVSAGVVGIVASEVTAINEHGEPIRVDKHPPHEVWVSADEECLPPLPDAVESRSGAQRIAEERQRQIEKWGPDHDQEHASGELAIRGAELAVYGTDESITAVAHEEDGWGLVAKNKDDRLRRLVIAGALIAAEIDRVLAESEAVS
jgi:hypothetical protein